MSVCFIIIARDIVKVTQILASERFLFHDLGVEFLSFRVMGTSFLIVGERLQIMTLAKPQIGGSLAPLLFLIEHESYD